MIFLHVSTLIGASCKFDHNFESGALLSPFTDREWTCRVKQCWKHRHN